MNAARYVLLAINVIIWSAVTWSGWRGISAIKSQHVAGYPNNGQLEYYVLFPVIVLLASMLLPLFLWRTRWPNYGTGFLIVTLILLVPYGCFYTGGV